MGTPRSDFAAVAGGSRSAQVGNIVAIDTPMTWSDASAYCQANYAGLASLHSGADQAAAVQACQSTSMKNDPLNPKGCWIGMNDDYEEGAFRWTDGTPNDFRAFQPGEPNGPPPKPSRSVRAHSFSWVTRQLRAILLTHSTA